MCERAQKTDAIREFNHVDDPTNCLAGRGSCRPCNGHRRVPTPTHPGQNQRFSRFSIRAISSPTFSSSRRPKWTTLAAKKSPTTGLYVAFDRTYVNVTRPIDQFSFGSGNQGDFTWGNRMEVGYMHGDPSGWQAVLWHVNGPNETFANSLIPCSEFEDQQEHAHAAV